MNNVTVINHRSADFPHSFAKWPSGGKTLFMNFSRTPAVTKSDLSPDFATALKIFNNIAQALGLNEQETQQLLGDDDLERIS
jgi:hypothetical protein